MEKNSEGISIKMSDEKHPVFQAHFPKNSLLAGFLLIDIIAEIYEESIITIIKSKFIAPVRPNDILICQVQTHIKKRSIRIYKNNKKISEIIYESK